MRRLNRHYDTGAPMIIAPGSISWDNSGNNKAYQSRQAAFVMNPSSIYAYLDGNDEDLQKVTEAIARFKEKSPTAARASWTAPASCCRQR